jgi:hypothetical protein
MIPINNVVARNPGGLNQNKQYSTVKMCVTFASVIDDIAPLNYKKF